MSSAPRIWLNYRPVRIGWLISDSSVPQLVRAATWSTALWGGRFYPVIPIQDTELAKNLVATFAVDLLIPIEQTTRATRFMEAFPHLYFTHSLHRKVFEDGNCSFVDIRHAVNIAAERSRRRPNVHPSRFLKPSWQPDDPLSALFFLLLGDYPNPDEVRIHYSRGIDATLRRGPLPLDPNSELTIDLRRWITPLDLTSWDLTSERDLNGWLSPGFVPRWVALRCVAS
jgi:hypothetical protein